MDTNYIHEDVGGGVPLKMWTRGVPVEDEAKRQLTNAARLPIVHHHIAAMPDVHFGIGATVGSVIPTLKAIIPAAVGVDIGCGMIACKTTLRAEDLPDNLAPLRSAIERAVPHGRQPGSRDPGAWQKAPGSVNTAWAQLEPEFTELCRDYPKLEKTNHIQHLGTLGTGNHFIEVCLDEAGFVWFMLHSGSRGVGNFIGTMFIELAKQDALRNNANRRELAGCVGLAPTPYASGDSEIEQGISKAGNRRIRAMLVEQSWKWLQLQPDSALTQWFNRRFASGGKRMRRVGIVALARRLVIALWRYLKHGEIPAGAVLKPLAV